MPIAELVAEKNAKLENARKAYYAGEPIMSDAEYDQLEEELNGLVKANPTYAGQAPVLTTVGSSLPLFNGHELDANPREAAAAPKGRIAHSVAMLSIENFYGVEDLCDWAEGLGWPVLSVGSKLDGVSDSLIYENGSLVQALTRGDGAFGESVLPQMRAAGAVPASIQIGAFFAGRVEIRGEVVIPESVLRALNAALEANGAKTYATSRNLAAGTLKLLDLNEVKRRGLQFRPWDVLLPHGAGPDSGVERLKSITAFGFAPSDDRIVRNREELIAAIEEMLPTLQEAGAEIGKDGIVVKVDSHELREKLGRGSKFTRYQVCFKPQNQKAETVIRSVDWQVGRQGRVTPVANVDPVVLGGAKIARSTLNNFTWLNALGLRIGSKIALVRSGDVIPKVTEVLENPPESSAIEAPAFCPDCEWELYERSEEDSNVTTHWCKNDQCGGRIRDYLTYIADRTVLEIDGLGPEIANCLYETGNVKSLKMAPALLFEFQVRTQSEVATQGRKAISSLFERTGFPVALTFRMLESLEKAKTAPWPVWIAAMAIPMVGRRLGKVLATHLNLRPDDFPRLPAKFAAIQVGEIDGLGVSKLGELHRFANDPEWVRVCSILYDYGVRPTAIVSASTGDSSLAGVAFVITGEFEEFGTRDEIAAKLEFRGAVAKSGVSKNVTHLLVGTNPGKSKLTKAEQLGIQQVGYDWLKQALS